MSLLSRETAITGSDTLSLGSPLGFKVLILDDSELCLQVGSEALTRDGFDVRTARNLDEFRQHLAAWQPDIILADVWMPEVNGAELCKQIKQTLDASLVPVVLFSMLPDDELAVLARRCNADAWASKSAGYDALSQTVQSLCESILW